MQLSRILGFSPDYLAKLQVANISTDRDLADYLDLDGLSHETGIPTGVLKQLSELAEWNLEASSKRIRTLALVAVLVIGLILTFAAWLKIKSYFDRVDRDANLAIGYIKDGDKACSQDRFPAALAGPARPRRNHAADQPTSVRQRRDERSFDNPVYVIGQIG